MRYIIPVISLFLLISCKTRYITEYQTVEVPVIHTELRTDTVRDSVHHTDSVVVFQRGDTVFSEKFRYITKWKERSKIVNNTDTLTKIVKKHVPVYVEKKLNKWQKIRMNVGGIVIILFGGFIVYKIILLWKKIKRT